jgi:hypothetical protein
MKVSLFLTSAQVLVHAQDESKTSGILGWFRQRREQHQLLSVHPANALAPINVEQGRWLAALTEALSLSRSLNGTSSQSIEADVELGLSHSRVGIMTVDQPDGILSVPSAKRDMYVQTWAEQMLHVSAQEQIIRWHAQVDPRHVLVSCVGRTIAADLAQACGAAGVRLMSCRPAVLSCFPAVQEFAPPEQLDFTVVWTEFAAPRLRYSAIQLLRFRNRRLADSWRGWVPPIGDLAADEALDAAAARFAAHHGVSSAEPCAGMRWPSHAFT